MLRPEQVRLLPASVPWDACCECCVRPLRPGRALRCPSGFNCSSLLHHVDSFWGFCRSLKPFHSHHEHSCEEFLQREFSLHSRSPGLPNLPRYRLDPWLELWNELHPFIVQPRRRCIFQNHPDCECYYGSDAEMFPVDRFLTGGALPRWCTCVKMD